jgi:hypothetical protein
MRDYEKFKPSIIVVLSTWIHPSIIKQGLVKTLADLGQLRLITGSSQTSDQSSGVPGGSRGHLVLFEHQNIFANLPRLLGEMVRQRISDNTTTNDDRPRMIREGLLGTWEIGGGAWEIQLGVVAGRLGVRLNSIILNNFIMICTMGFARQC